MIFRKTAKGQTEIDSATRALPQKLRTVLVLIDGKRSMQELAQLLATATPHVLLDLKTLGMIEVVPQPVAAAAPAKDAAASRSDSRLDSRLPDARHDSRHDSSHDSRLPSPRTSARAGSTASRFENSVAPSRFEHSRAPSRFEPSRAPSRFEHSRAPSRFDAAASPEDEPATDEQREQIERSLSRALGPAADGLIHGIRQARTVRDLMDVVSTAQRAISNARGKDMADEFASRYGHIDEI